nr:hypothetical protein [Tanacetum cinerariifolium]
MMLDPFISLRVLGTDAPLADIIQRREKIKRRTIMVLTPFSLMPPLSAGASSKAKNEDKKFNEDTDSKTNEELVDHVDQSFLEELERLKRQEKEASDAAETFRKTFAQSTEDLLLQAGAARFSSTNFVNTTTTPVNAASIPTNQDAS